MTKYAGHVQNKFQTTLIENVIVSENEDATFPIREHGPTEIYPWIVWGPWTKVSVNIVKNWH
jgi:hypothetical protein